jgi:hypothetical protein
MLFDSDCACQGVKKCTEMLQTLDSWIEEIPALETPQRFGNLAFREWGKRLEEVGTVSIVTSSDTLSAS